MNQSTKLILSLGLLAAPLAVLAATPEQAYVDAYRAHSQAGPLPVTVYSPIVSSDFAGQNVLIGFTVDVHGRPRHFTSLTQGVDPYLVESITRAVREWKFTPDVVEGRPVARRVTLPVEIVAPRE